MNNRIVLLNDTTGGIDIITTLEPAQALLAGIGTGFALFCLFSLFGYAIWQLFKFFG